jgi:DNA-directed RNA polymerase specialized sigma24 family protein
MARVEQCVVFRDGPTVYLRPPRPETDLQALMECRPNVEPPLCVSGLQPLREAVAECMELLSAEDRFVLDAWFSERMTVRGLAERMGLHKSYTHRMVQRAVDRMEALLREHATIQDRLGVAPVEHADVA